VGMVTLIIRLIWVTSFSKSLIKFLFVSVNADRVDIRYLSLCQHPFKNYLQKYLAGFLRLSTGPVFVCSFWGGKHEN